MGGSSGSALLMAMCAAGAFLVVRRFGCGVERSLDLSEKTN